MPFSLSSFNKQSIQGFGLLEVLLVLGVVGILGSLAVVSFRPGIGNPGLSSQVREVQAVFDTARSHAVKTNSPTCIALRTELPSRENQNQCSTRIEYFYSLSRAENLACDVLGFGNVPNDVQVHRKSILGLAYDLPGVPPFGILEGCPFYYVRTFTFQPGSGFLKAGGQHSIASLFASNNGFIEFFNPRVDNSNVWRFRVERSGVLTLSEGESRAITP
jgi:prepilin-type N-terminal cleavage/methylation domain-containing protein